MRTSPPAILFAAVVVTCDGFRLGTRFLVASSPSTRNIYYTPEPSSYELARPHHERGKVKARLLIDGSAKCASYSCFSGYGRGLEAPGALAVHEGGDGTTLYVADTKAECIFAYTVFREAFDWIRASDQRVVQQNTSVRGLALDSLGNLFYTTADGSVAMLNAEVLAAQAPTPVATAPGSKPVILYTPEAKGEGTASMAGPAGIAADNFFVFWANSQGDPTTGVVIKAPEYPSPKYPIRAIAANSDLNEVVALNLCIARDTVFFTGETRSLFAVKSVGGVIAEVARNFSTPRGCVYDLESTLFLADGGDNAIYALPANLPSLRAVNTRVRIVDVPDPAGIAIFGASRLRRSTASSLQGSNTACAIVTFVSVMVGCGLGM